MACKSILYAAMQTPVTVAEGGVIPQGSTIRQHGCDIRLNGNAVNIFGGRGCDGIYDVDVSITLAPTAAGAVTATLYKDGVAYPGATATATATAAGDEVVLSFPASVRQACCAVGASLTLVLSGGGATVNNVALRVKTA